MSTKIEWAEETWNPVTGCTPISPGCVNCYAKRMAKRLAGRCGYPGENPFAVTLHPGRLEQPMTWSKPRRVFVCSMSDLFHEAVTDGFLVQVFSAMRRGMTERGHTFMVLTKRPARMREFLSRLRWNGGVLALDAVGGRFAPMAGVQLLLGVTVENSDQRRRIPELLNTPGIRRFVSVEPMLEPIDLTPWLPWLDWVICGGETGPGHRPMSGLWAMDLLEQCRAYGVPFFFKQMAGKSTPLPKSLQVREFPAGMLDAAPEKQNHV
jgi:protein gp37